MEIFGCRVFVGVLQLAMGPERKQNAKRRRILLVLERDQCNWSSEPDTWLEPHNHVQVGVGLVSGHSLPFILCESIIYISYWGLDPVTYLWLFVEDPVPEKDGISPKTYVNVNKMNSYQNKLYKWDVQISKFQKPKDEEAWDSTSYFTYLKWDLLIFFTSSYGTKLHQELFFLW
jgi:hypothetical protein